MGAKHKTYIIEISRVELQALVLACQNYIGQIDEHISAQDRIAHKAKTAYFDQEFLTTTEE